MMAFDLLDATADGTRRCHVTYHTLDTPCELEYLFSNY